MRRPPAATSAPRAKVKLVLGRLDWAEDFREATLASFTPGSLPGAHPRVQCTTFPPSSARSSRDISGLLQTEEGEVVAPLEGRWVCSFGRRGGRREGGADVHPHPEPAVMGAVAFLDRGGWHLVTEGGQRTRSGEGEGGEAKCGLSARFPSPSSPTPSPVPRPARAAQRVEPAGPGLGLRKGPVSSSRPREGVVHRGLRWPDAQDHATPPAMPDSPNHLWHGSHAPAWHSGAPKRQRHPQADATSVVLPAARKPARLAPQSPYSIDIRYNPWPQPCLWVPRACPRPFGAQDQMGKSLPHPRPAVGEPDNSLCSNPLPDLGGPGAYQRWYWPWYWRRRGCRAQGARAATGLQSANAAVSGRGEGQGGSRRQEPRERERRERKREGEREEKKRMLCGLGCSRWRGVRGADNGG